MNAFERALDGLEVKLKLERTPKLKFIQRVLYSSGVFFGMTVVALAVLLFVDLSFLAKK